MCWNSGSVSASMRLCGTLGFARIIRGNLWVLLWFTGKESPERENNSPVHPVAAAVIAWTYFYKLLVVMGK